MTQKKINNLIDDYVIYGAGEAGKQIYSSLTTIKKKYFVLLMTILQKQNKTLFKKKLSHKILLKIC